MSVFQRRRIARTIISTYKDFAENTSIHGLKYTVQKNNSTCTKVLWAAIVCIGFTQSMYMINLFCRKYESNPTRTIIFDQNASVMKFLFPAVTICPGNRYLKNKLEDFVSNLNFGSYNKTKIKKQLMKYLQHPYTEYVEVKEAIDVLSTNGYDTVNSFIRFISQNCSEMIVSCVWNAEKIDCNKKFDQIIYSNRICCAFNYRAKKPLYNNKFGINTGLLLVIDPMIQHQDYDLSLTLGVKVYIHYPEKNPLGSSNVEVISPKNLVHLQLSATGYKCGADVKSLTKEERKCLLRNEMKLTYFQEYTRENCILECELMMIFNICKCYVTDFGVVVEPTCTLANLSCLHSIETLENEEYKGELNCKYCASQCEDVFYNVVSTSTQIQSDFKYFKYPQSTNYNNTFHPEAIVLSVYFHSEGQLEFLKDTTTSVVYLLSSLGGIYSLFLGCSIISCLEIFYYIFVRFFVNLKNVGNPLKVHPKPIKPKPFQCSRQRPTYHKNSDKVFFIYGDKYLE